MVYIFTFQFVIYGKEHLVIVMRLHSVQYSSAKVHKMVTYLRANVSIHFNPGGNTHTKCDDGGLLILSPATPKQP